jgi:hypothetical protein
MSKISLTDMVSVVLVGLCNNDPRNQIYLGTFKYYQRSTYGPHPIIMGLGDAKNEGRTKPFPLRFIVKQPGSYIFAFDEGACVVTINLCTKDGVYRFSTGTGYDLGSSGQLCNGGPEIVEFLDRYFEVTT